MNSLLLKLAEIDAKQKTNYTCGPSAAAASLKDIGVDTSEEEIKELAGTTKEEGTTSKQLQKALAAKNVSGKISEKKPNKNDLVRISTEGEDHWIRVIDKLNDKYKIDDPWTKGVEVRSEKFLDKLRNKADKEKNKVVSIDKKASIKTATVLKRILQDFGGIPILDKVMAKQKPFVFGRDGDVMRAIFEERGIPSTYSMISRDALNNFGVGNDMLGDAALRMFRRDLGDTDINDITFWDTGFKGTIPSRLNELLINNHKNELDQSRLRSYEIPTVLLSRDMQEADDSHLSLRVHELGKVLADLKRDNLLRSRDFERKLTEIPENIDTNRDIRNLVIADEHSKKLTHPVLYYDRAGVAISSIPARSRTGLVSNLEDIKTRMDRFKESGVEDPWWATISGYFPDERKPGFNPRQLSPSEITDRLHIARNRVEDYDDRSYIQDLFSLPHTLKHASIGSALTHSISKVTNKIKGVGNGIKQVVKNPITAGKAALPHVVPQLLEYATGMEGAFNDFNFHDLMPALKMYSGNVVNAARRAIPQIRQNLRTGVHFNTAPKIKVPVKRPSPVFPGINQTVTHSIPGSTPINILAKSFLGK